MTGQKPSRRGWRPFVLGLTAAFVALLVVIVVLADRGELPDSVSLVRRLPFGDALCHFLLVGGLAFLVNLSLRARRFRLWRLSILAGSVVVGVVVTLEEASQAFLPQRTFSWLDLFADYAGIAVMGRAALYLVRRSEARPPEGSEADTEQQAEAVQEPPKPPDQHGPSHRAIIGWSAGMLAALGLAWFVGTAVIRLMDARAATKRCLPLADSSEWDASARSEVKKLGGARRAVPLLSTYARLPGVAREDRFTAKMMICACREEAQPTITELTEDEDPYVRFWAAVALARMGKPEAIAPLLRETKGGDDAVKLVAGEALEAIDRRSALARLEQIARQEDSELRDTATWALIWLRGEDKGKGDRGVAEVLRETRADQGENPEERK